MWDFYWNFPYWTNVSSPTHIEEKEKKFDATNVAFYVRLVRTHVRCTRHDVKFVIGEFNAWVQKKGIFVTADKKYQVMVVCNIRIQHEKIHQATLEQKTWN